MNWITKYQLKMSLFERPHPKPRQRRAKPPAWPQCTASWQTSSNSAWPSTSSSQAASTPPLSSTRPTVAAADTTVVVRAEVVLVAATDTAVSHNSLSLLPSFFPYISSSPTSNPSESPCLESELSSPTSSPCVSQPPLIPSVSAMTMQSPSVSAALSSQHSMSLPSLEPSHPSAISTSLHLFVCYAIYKSLTLSTAPMHSKRAMRCLC